LYTQFLHPQMKAVVRHVFVSFAPPKEFRAGAFWGILRRQPLSLEAKFVVSDGTPFPLALFFPLQGQVTHALTRSLGASLFVSASKFFILTSPERWTRSLALFSVGSPCTFAFVSSRITKMTDSYLLRWSSFEHLPPAPTRTSGR